jgi:hypothetical protein
MAKNSSLQFYLDTLVIQSAFGDENLRKQAEESVAGELISAVKNYVGSKIDQDDKGGTIVNVLAPGVVVSMLRALGLGWLSYVAGIAMNVFHVDVNSIIKSILETLLPKIKDGVKLTQEEVASTVESAFAPEANKEMTQEETEQLKKSFTVREATLYRVGMEETIKEYQLTKNAGLFDLISGGRKGTVSLLAKAIKWIFFVVLSSAGVMVAGDAINLITGRPNSFNGTIQNGKPINQQVVSSPVISTQTKFKLNPNYNNKILNSKNATWVETGTASASNVQDMVLEWMSEVYEGTKQYENVAVNTVGFKNVVQEIIDYNSGNMASTVMYIPRMFSTKKNAIDIFIDQVANKAPSDSFTNKKPGTITA